MRSAEYLNSSLSAEQTNRLKLFRRNLAITRGIDGNRFYDDKAVDVVLKYAHHPSQVLEQLEYLRTLKDPLGFPFSRNLRIYSTTEDALKRFSEPNHTYYGWNNHFRSAVKRLKKELSFGSNLKPLRYKSDDDIINALPKLNTHSGFTFIESGVKDKGKNLENIFERHQKTEEEAVKLGTFNRPILIGFRTQASGEYDDEGNQTDTCKHKCRVISMVDLYVIISELKFAKPVQDLLSRKQSYAGGKNEDDIGRIISNWRAKYSAYYSIDYSSFDQTLSNWLIREAFEVIRYLFANNLTDYENQLLDVIIHDFINKVFVCYEGDVVSHKGVPSGSMWTQIVDSVCNLLMIYTYFDYLGIDSDCIVMGDDNLMFTRENYSPDFMTNLASYLYKLFGVVINAEKSSGGTVDSDPEFLSRYWTKYGRWRHPNSLLSRIAYPERYRNYSSEVTPQHVILAFCLSYNCGMNELINVKEFRRENPISSAQLFQKVDSRYLPGVMAYIREYG